MLGIKKSITIRNLTEELVEGLKALAESRDRTMEGEVRTALRSWVETNLKGNAEPQIPKRYAEISERINQALQLVSETPSLIVGSSKKGFTGAHLAEGIGEQYVQPVYDWMEGKAEPSFEALDRIAEWCGVDADWLKTGTGTPYLVQNVRVPESPFQGAFWLLKISEENVKSPLSRLRFIRQAGKRGQLMIIREYTVGFDIYTTPYVVSNDTGAGGRASLESLCEIWQVLYCLYTARDIEKNSGLMITSHIVSEHVWERLESGNVNPGRIIFRDCGNSPWWEDIWDKDMLAKHRDAAGRGNEETYWPGYISLATSLQAEIQKRSPKLKELLAHLKYEPTSEYFKAGAEYH